MQKDLYKAKKLTEAGDIVGRNKIVERVSRDISRFVVNLSGSTVEVIGKEHIPPKGQPLLLVANHQSAFDPPLIMGYLDRPITFVSKKENLSLPFIGKWIKYSNCVVIDRGNTRSAVKTMNEGAKIIKQGYIQGLFPEGTRSVDGQIQDFKVGGFKLAEKSGADILPVTIVDAHKLMPKNTLSVRKQHIKIIVSPIVESEGKKTHEMASICHDIIAENLKKYQK